MHSHTSASQLLLGEDAPRGQQQHLGERQQQQRDGKEKTASTRHSTEDQTKSGSATVMGGLQARLSHLSSSSSTSGPSHASHTPSTTAHSDHPDGRGFVAHPSVARVLEKAEKQVLPLRRRRDFQSLDRSLKSFLRASNLPGLEYRLKLAGYQRLDDLLDTNVEMLVSDGFTRLMAKRLMTALDNYIQQHFDVTDGQPSPFQLVRRGHLGQKIKSNPSEEMKALPNYGRRNVKRQSSSEPVLFRSGKKHPAPKQQHTSTVRLMSEEQIPSEPIFPNVIDARDSVFIGEEEERTSQESDSERSSMTSSSTKDMTSSTSGSSQMIEIGRVVETRSPMDREEDSPAIIPVNTTKPGAMFEEHFLDDIDTPVPTTLPAAVKKAAAIFGEAKVSEQQEPVSKVPPLQPTSPVGHRDSIGYKLRPTASVPAGLWLSSPSESTSPQYPERTYIRVRAYSCPSSIASMATPLEASLLVLTSSRGVDSIVMALKQLISQLRARGEGDAVKLRCGDVVSLVEGGVLSVLRDVLQTTVSSQGVVELCCTLLKLLTREGVMGGLPFPTGVAVAILKAMSYHLSSEGVQTEGCWTLGNIARTDPSQCDDIISNGGLQTISMAMKSFPFSVNIQVVAMTTVGVVLGATKEARLLLMSEHGRALDVVFQMMHNYPSEPKLQRCACSLLALLTEEVGAQIERGVMQQIVEHAAFALTTHSHDSHVTLQATKTFANAADNTSFSADPKLASRITDLLAEVIVRFPDDSTIVKLSSYALLQLSSSGCGGVVNDIIKGSRHQLLSYCQNPPTSLTDEAKGYLMQLKGQLC